MSYIKLKNCLRKSVGDANLGVSVAWDNQAFVPPENSPWVSASVLDTSANVTTLGDGGYDRWLGFLQLGYNAPLNTGESSIDSFVEKIRSYYIAGKSFTYEGQSVTVSKVESSPYLYEKNLLKKYVTIYLRAELTRTLIT